MAHAPKGVFWEVQDSPVQEMLDTSPEQELSGPPELLCPQSCCPKSTAPHLQCPAATALGHGCFLEASHGLVRCCLKDTVYVETGKKGYAFKCGNAAVFRDKFLCFRGCGREHLWSEQNGSSSSGLCSVSCLPPPAPGTSTACSLGPGIWVRISNVLFLIQKPQIAWEHSFLWWLPRPGLCPEIVVRGSVGGLGHGLSTVGELWPLRHPQADGRQQGSQHPMGQQAQLSLWICAGDMACLP